MASSLESWQTVAAFSNRSIALCIVLLIMAGAEFMVRGPMRAAVGTAGQFNDFLSPWIQAKALIHGLDPYSPQVLLNLWPPEAPHYSFLPREVANGTLVANRGIPTAYPVTAFVLIVPFTALSWKLAYAVWFAINLVLFAIMLRMMISLAGLSLRDPRALLLIAATLALAPFQTGIVTANVSLVAVELCVIAVWTARRHQDIATAALLAVAAGLKPQIGLCFVLYYLLRRCWTVAGISLAMLGSLVMLGLLRFEFGHTPWLADYLSDNHILLETGVLGNFTAINPTRFGLINLQVALYPLIGNVRLTNDAAEAVGGMLLITWSILIWVSGAASSKVGRKWSGEDCDLLALSTIAVISLLPVYHRFYDATLLVFPLCWIFVSFRRAHGTSLACLLLLAPFLIPGGTLLETMQISGRIPASLSQHWWWEAFVMAHQVWALLILSVLLVRQMWVKYIFHPVSDKVVGSNA
jgi:hypothetical protein